MKIRGLQVVLAVVMLSLGGCENKEVKTMNQTVRAVAGEWVIDDFIVSDAQAPQNVVQLVTLPTQGQFVFSSCSVGESGGLEGCDAFYSTGSSSTLNFQYGTEPKNRNISFRMNNPGDEKLKRALEGDWKIAVVGSRMIAEKVRGYDSVTGGLKLSFTADKK